MKYLISLLLLLFFTLKGFSQDPGNTCASAVSLTLPAVGSSINTGTRTTCGTGNGFASGFSNVSSLYGGGEDGVYSITVPAGGGNYTFSFSATGATYKILSIHSACAPTTANTIGGFTTGSGTSGSTTLTLSAGTYFLIIDTWPAPNCGQFNLTITRNSVPSVPVNDNCSGATNLPCATNNLAGTTVGAISESAPLGYSSNFGVWYKFTGDGQQSVISSSAVFDHEMTIMTGSSCSSFSLVASVDDFIANETESYTFTTINGQQYYIYVAHYSTLSSETGTFTISRTCSPASNSNDFCSNAISITLPYTSATTSINSATDDVPSSASGCATLSSNLWYKVTGNGTTFTATTCDAATNYDSEIRVYTGNCTSLNSMTEVTCDDDDANCGFSGAHSTVSWCAQNSVEYFITVGYFVSGGGTGSFKLSVTSGTSCSVLPIELSTFSGTNSGEYNLISWTTASETNNDFFTLERSNDFNYWEIVDNMGGAGNSLTYQYYWYKDFDFKKNQLNYYRLKQTDFDGNFEYSKIIVVKNDFQSKLLKTISIDGKEVDKSYRGFVIDWYNDGTYKKRIQLED